MNNENIESILNVKKKIKLSLCLKVASKGD